MIDAWDGLQQAALLGVVDEGVVDVPVEVLHAPVEVVVSVDQVGEQEAVGLAQRQTQGIAEEFQARANVPAERVQDIRAGPAGDQPVEDAPAIEAEDVAEHAPDADAAPVEDLLHPVTDPAALPDQRAPMAHQIPQIAKRLVGYETGPAEPELAHPGQPAAVFDIGLAAAQLPHVLRLQ